jgi:hypothetical protein
MFQLLRLVHEARGQKPTQTDDGVGIMPPRKPTCPRPVFIMLNAQDQTPSVRFHGEVNAFLIYHQDKYIVIEQN